MYKRQVKELLPAGVTLLSMASSQGACVDHICQLGNIGVDQPAVITASVRVISPTMPPGTVLTNLVRSCLKDRPHRAVNLDRPAKGHAPPIRRHLQDRPGQTEAALTYDDLEVDSPYNTYKHAGLPPTPIANPGLAALKAAANPTDDKYLYYVARNDGTGRHYFSTTYEQFLVDKAKAAANGG